MSSDQPSERRAANLFDLRRIIGGLFVVYGVVLAALGLFDSQEEIDRAAGVNINLWTGLGMLLFGILMLVWALSRPLSEQLTSHEPAGTGTRRDRERPGGGGETRGE